MSLGTQTSGSDRATVSVTVAADPATAFTVFTQETDLWWRRGPKFRVSGRYPGVLIFEPGVGGRLMESYDADGETRVFVTGKITAWEPPSRLAFEWRGVNFAGGEFTEVEVLFEAAESGTRVTVHHRGWAILRADHPARHGLHGPEFIRMIGMWWGELMTSMREHCDYVRARSPEST